MKLYTEESVIKLTKAAYTAGNNNNKFIFEIEFKDVTPIELPTDEEIDDKNPYKICGGNYNSQAAYQWQRGVEWVIEQIKKQK